MLSVVRYDRLVRTRRKCCVSAATCGSHMLSVVPSEFDSISTGLFSGPSTSTWIGQPFDWIAGIVSPQSGVNALEALLTFMRRASQMHRDMHGLPISTASPGAAAAFDRTLAGYLKYRADVAGRLGEALAADGEFGLAHCLKGYFALLSYKQANVPMAVEAAQTARRFTAGASGRAGSGAVRKKVGDAWR